MFIFIQSFVAMRYESFLWLEENYWRIEWLTGELLWGARPDNIKWGMMTASRSKLSCTKIKGLVPWPTFPEGTTQESFSGQTTYCKPKFNQLRRDSTYSWKKVGVELPKYGCILPLPRMRTRRFWKRWSRNMVIYWYYRNRQQMTMAARMQKRWSIKQKTIDFSTTTGNFHMLHYGTSWTKQCIREKKVESDFEGREQYEANLQQEWLL